MTATKKALITALLSLLIVGAVSFAAVAQHARTEATVQPQITVKTVQPPTVDELFKLVNEERIKAGVKPLVIDERLNKSAQQKADDMSVNNYNSHIDKNGRHGYDIAHEYAPDVCLNPSENLFWGNTKEFPNSSAGAVNWWMQSKPHRDAILNENNTYTGFGISGTKVVEHFC